MIDGFFDLIEDGFSLLQQNGELAPYRWGRRLLVPDCLGDVHRVDAHPSLGEEVLCAGEIPLQRGEVGGGIVPVV